MATRNLTRKYVDIRNAQRANRVTGFHENNVRVNGEDQGSLLETVNKILSFISFHFLLCRLVTKSFHLFSPLEIFCVTRNATSLSI